MINQEKVKQRHARYNKSALGVARLARYYKKIRDDVFSHYGNICACCGEGTNQFLCIDHIDNGRKNPADRINGTGLVFYIWLRKNNYPTGYQTLCHNCNAAKSSYGECPHRKTS